jgi:hypothetical protein
MNQFDIPILFLIFNRPETTILVFNEIRKIKPKTLYIAADGPRSIEEEKICIECRSISEKIDWECDLKILYRRENLGCKLAVSEAITWFFENNEMGIILEDDCLPLPSFFPFCKELLIKYKDEVNIMHISGNNFQLGNDKNEQSSYYFSRYPHIWGWASWKRAWLKYDIEMKNYPKLLKNKEFVKYADNFIMKLVYEKKLSTWDSQWLYSVNFENGLSILPRYNLVKNIGFSEKNATNTIAVPKWFKKMIYKDIETIIHPISIKLDDKADLFTRNNILSNKRMRIKEKIRKIISSLKLN